MNYVKVSGTEVINYWVQIYKHNYWDDCWKHESLESAQKQIDSVRKAWPEAEYRIVKRQIVEEIL